MLRRVVIGISWVVAMGNGVWAQPKGQPEGQETVYFAVFLEGKKCGYGEHSRIVDHHQVRTKEGYRLSFNRGNVRVNLSLWETSIETLDGKPIGFETSQTLGAMAIESTGSYHPAGYFDVQIKTAGIDQQRHVPLPQGTLMAEGLRLMGLKVGLVEGHKLEVKIFTPSLLSAIDAEVVVGRREKVDLLGRIVELTRVETTLKMPTGSMTGISYVDDDQLPQKMVMSAMEMTMEMVACDHAYALSPNDPPELIAKTVLISPKPLGDIKQLAALRYRLRSKSDQPLTLPSDTSQRLISTGPNEWFLTIDPQRPAKGQPLPYRGKEAQALAALKPSAYVQSDHPEIIALAQRAVGNTSDAAEAAGRIERFVHKHIQEKSLSVGWASAVEVARSQEGDCSEHAVLTAALCQAVGIPARVATGYVYVPDFLGHKNVFGGHAWTQVYIHGHWFGLDATRAPNGYSAAHITCATGNGNPESFFEMALAGSQFEIISIESVSLQKLEEDL